MGNRPSWTGGAAAAKPQPGWLFRILRNAPWIFLNERFINHMEIISVIEQPPRRFAPPLLSRRGDRPMSCKYVLASEIQFGQACLDRRAAAAKPQRGGGSSSL